ncbi:MAG: GTP cyclohydrolase I FolE [Phycisphaerae bacterium]
MSDKSRSVIAAVEEIAFDTNGHSVPVRKNDSAPATRKTIDIPRIERAVREILAAVGEDPTREGLMGTPNRVARAYGELFAGLYENPRRHLSTVFDEEHQEIVVLRDIPFHSLCEHHLLPFTGNAHVGYLPNGKVVGLSKLARLVEGYARRPQVQERLTSQIADALHEELDAAGVGVVIEASHTCMTMRGISKPGSKMITSALRGTFRSDPRSRAEFMNLLQLRATP